MSEDLYREQILDHYGDPRNKGKLEDADITCEWDNPLCGDTVRLDIKLEDGRVSDMRFEGQGCVISMASASMFTEKIQGKTLEELRALKEEDMLEMLGVELGSSRIKCGVLPLQVLQKGLEEWEKS